MSFNINNIDEYSSCFYFALNRTSSQSVICEDVYIQQKPVHQASVAERTRFELVDRIAPVVGLANRWFQPLTHLSLALCACKVSAFWRVVQVFLRFFVQKGLHCGANPFELVC